MVTGNTTLQTVTAVSPQYLIKLKTHKTAHFEVNRNNTLCSNKNELSELCLHSYLLCCAVYHQEVIRLGGRVVHSAVMETTHLVANSVLRTVKFLTALAVVQHVVTSEWIERSSVANQFLGN